MNISTFLRHVGDVDQTRFTEIKNEDGSVNIALSLKQVSTHIWNTKDNAAATKKYAQIIEEAIVRGDEELSVGVCTCLLESLMHLSISNGSNQVIDALLPSAKKYCIDLDAFWS